MSVTPSTMLPLGTLAPNFSLPSTDGTKVSLNDFKDAPALLVMFICNHCPFVKHIEKQLVPLVKDQQARGVAVVSINSNDASQYPDDRPEKMAEVAEASGYTFPYLYDETQEVAKAYRAACTPDFFLFDAEKTLFYRGRMDDSRPGNDRPVTGQDLIEAINAVLAGKGPPKEQHPSAGCNIKWKRGNEPDYFG